jgi:hypothetical protein
MGDAQEEADDEEEEKQEEEARGLERANLYTDTVCDKSYAMNIPPKVECDRVCLGPSIEINASLSRTKLHSKQLEGHGKYRGGWEAVASPRDRNSLLVPNGPSGFRLLDPIKPYFLE